MRQIVLDTETTGLDPKNGHRIIEIGCVELVDRKVTGQHFHRYINPEREVEEEALKVHNLTNEFLQDKPLFRDIHDEFLTFINGAELIIHNAPFDLGFLDMEMQRVHAKAKQLKSLCSVIDTLVMARKLFPGQKNNLDALCKRFEVNNIHREWHGGLLDAEILARVYLAMTGGQTSLFSDHLSSEKKSITFDDIDVPKKAREHLVVLKASSDELVLHEAFLKKLNQENW